MGLNYPMKFRLAWEDVMFNHFHDAMGCSAEQVFDDAYAFAGEALSSPASKDISTQAISWAVDTAK